MGDTLRYKRSIPATATDMTYRCASAWSPLCWENERGTRKPRQGDANNLRACLGVAEVYSKGRAQHAHAQVNARANGRKQLRARVWLAGCP